MNKKFFLIVFSILAANIAAQFNTASISIDTLYSIVYENNAYISTQSPEFVGGVKSSYSTNYGELNIILKKSQLSEISSGNYKIQLEELFSKHYRIKGTQYVIKIGYGYINSFSTYIMKSSGYSLELLEQ